MSRPHSLRLRLLGAMVAVFALGVGAAILSYRTEVYNITSDLRTRTLENQARELLQAVRIGEDGSLQVNTPDDWRQVYSSRSQHFVFTVFDAAHHPVAWSANLQAPLPYIPVDSRGSLGPVEFIGAGPARRAIVAARGPRGSIIIVGRGDRDRDELVDSLFEEGSEQLTVVAPFALLGLVLIWLISGWSLRPIARASHEAARVGPRRPDMRISPRGLPERSNLWWRPSTALSTGYRAPTLRSGGSPRMPRMSFARPSRFSICDCSARSSPATPIGAQSSESSPRWVGWSTSSSISPVRNRWRGSGTPADLPIINLSRVVREAAAAVLPLMEAAGRELEVDVPDSIQVRGNSDDLRDMVRNLLENALLHGRGKVSARIAIPERGSDAMSIEVADEGPGVPLGQEEAVFQRFRRLNVDSPGSGLGLAIVRHVARSHGGDARFLPGIGRVVVSLPQSGYELRDRAGERDAADQRTDQPLEL